MSRPSSYRIDKLLAGLGYGSRSEIAQMVRQGGVRLDEKGVFDVGAKIKVEDASRLLVRGEPLDFLPGMVVMLHKPVGFTCSHEEAGPLVYDQLPQRWRLRNPVLSSVGRLDKETSGLLLLTDDGALLHRLISPRHHVPKTYIADLAQPLRGDEAEQFASGALMLKGESKPLLPAELTILSPTKARIVVREGRYHQLRRMFAAVGNHVEALHRSAFGALHLAQTLQPGEYMLLSALQRESLAHI